MLYMLAIYNNEYKIFMYIDLIAKDNKKSYFLFILIDNYKNRDFSDCINIAYFIY